MADLTKLKKEGLKGKGTPPSIEQAPRNTDIAPREKPEKSRHMQFSITEDIADKFDAEAAKQFGFRKGAKKQMFLKIWNDYMDQNNITA